MRKGLYMRSLKLIAAIEMVSGITFVLLSTWPILTFPFNWEAAGLSLFLVGLGILPIIAGWLLWRRHPYGLLFSLIVIGLQILSFETPWLSWSFTTLNGLDLKFGLNLTPLLQLMNLQNTDEPISFEISVIAMVGFIYLNKASKGNG